jgi:hypothetical protein
MSTRRLRLIAVLAPALSGLAPAVPTAAAADETPAAAGASDPAASAFDEGTRSFRAGRYAEAAASYERAASLRSHPLPLVNAAEAWERAGDAVQAAVACDRALTLPMDGAMRPKVEARLARLLLRIGTLDISGPSQFQIQVDGGEPLRPPARLRVSPGRHRLLMVDESSQRSVEREVLVGAGEEHHIVVSSSQIDVSAPATTLSPEPSMAPPPRPSDGGGSGPPLGSWIAFGVAGAAAATSGVFGALTLGAKSDFDARPTAGAADSFERNRLITNVALGVAGAAAIAGVVLWVAKPSPAQRASAKIGTNGSALILFGCF